VVYVIRVGVNRSHGGVGGKQVTGPSELGRMRVGRPESLSVRAATPGPMGGGSVREPVRSWPFQSGRARPAEGDMTVRQHTGRLAVGPEVVAKRMVKEAGRDWHI